MQTSTPLVSVVIPCYNCAPLVGETIASVLAQSYPHIEIIAVNDGSTDNTAEVLASFSQVVLVNQENGGLAAARNFGMQQAKGDYIVWLDADDLIEPDKIALQVAVMQGYPPVVLCCTDFSAFNEQGIFDHAHSRCYYSRIQQATGLADFYPNQTVLSQAGRTIPLFYGDLSDELLWGNIIHPPTVMLRRQAVEQLTGLDGTLAQGTDYEYFIRISQLGDVACLDCPLLRYRCSAQQMSADQNLGSILRANVKVLEKIERDYYDKISQHHPQFQQRIGEAYLKAARFYAATEGRFAWQLLAKAVRRSGYQPYILLILFLILTPRRLLAWLKQQKGQQWP